MSRCVEQKACNAPSNDILQVPPILLAKSRVTMHKSLVGATKVLVYMSLSKLSSRSVINFLVIILFEILDSNE